MTIAAIAIAPMIGRLTVPSYTSQARGLEAKSMLATEDVPAGIKLAWTILTALVKMPAKVVAERTPNTKLTIPTNKVLKTFPFVYGRTKGKM